MYTIKFKDGDWDFTNNRSGNVITGKEKLVQQLSLWIDESLGIDRFHPEYGCNLQNLVGSINSQETIKTVENELARVIQDYMDYQAIEFDKHPQDWSKEEVVAALLSIQSEIIDDSLYCDIFVRTLANEDEHFKYRVDL